MDLVSRWVIELYWLLLALCWNGVLYWAFSLLPLSCRTNRNIVTQPKNKCFSDSSPHSLGCLNTFIQVFHEADLSMVCSLPGLWPIKCTFIYCFQETHLVCQVMDTVALNIPINTEETSKQQFFELMIALGSISMPCGMTSRSEEIRTSGALWRPLQESLQVWHKLCWH